MLEGNLVNPVMRPNSQKDNSLTIGKSEQYPITSIDTKTPHLLSFRLELFGVERRVKRILSKKFFLLFGFLLDIGGQQFVSFYKFVSQQNLQDVSPVLIV